MHEELKDYGFTVVTVALDQCADDPRPFIEAAAPTHPSLIDSEHLVADLYRIINVPTVVWIDEHGRRVRPNDVAFGNDAFKDMHGIESAPHLNALRRWVKENTLPLDEQQVRELQILPTPEEQLDPMGPDFAELYTEWVQAGRPYYRPIPAAKDG